MTCRVAPSRRNAEVAEEEDGMLCFEYSTREAERVREDYFPRRSCGGMVWIGMWVIDNAHSQRDKKKGRGGESAAERKHCWALTEPPLYHVGGTQRSIGQQLA